MKSLNEISKELWQEFGVVKLYARGRKRFGTRSHILIVPATFCTIETARMIAARFANRHFGSNAENRVVVIEHEVGCCSVGIDEHGSLRILRNSSHNPNIAAVLVVSLGCGAHCSPSNSSGESARTGSLITSIQGPRRQEEVVVQGPGGRNDAVERGVKMIEAMIQEVERTGRVETSLADLVPGVMNGSSDPTSGLFTNPATGIFCDFLMNANGRIAFSQTTEMLGAEKIMLARADSDRVQQRMARLLSAATTMRMAVELEGVETEPTQGNLRSGISTLKEKSVGTLFKIGMSPKYPIVDVVPHGKTIGSKSGIYLVDGPGQDVLCMSGLVAAGANVVLFTTGRGAPTGSPLAPTIKITSNFTTQQNMPELIDVYLPVEEIFEQGRSMAEIALQTLVPYVHAVASGTQLTAAELSGQRDFQVRQLWPIE
jgi:altronate dehydratase large subunit